MNYENEENVYAVHSGNKQKKSPKMIKVVGGEATLGALRALPFDQFMEAIRTPAPAKFPQKGPLAIGTSSKRRRHGSGYYIACHIGPGKQVEIPISIDEVAEAFRERIVEAKDRGEAVWLTIQ